MATEEIYIDNFIKDLKEMALTRRLMGFHQKPFYGEVAMKFQDGKWYVFEIRHTEK